MLVPKVTRRARACYGQSSIQQDLAERYMGPFATRPEATADLVKAQGEFQIREQSFTADVICNKRSQLRRRTSLFYRLPSNWVANDSSHSGYCDQRADLLLPLRQARSWMGWTGGLK